MEVVFARCAGIDVHKRSVTTHARLVGAGSARRQIRAFGTFTQELLEMRDWLKDLGVTHVAMESTGAYWKPVYNLLEGEFEILVCNAQHVKNVPGRKTDIKDAEWIAELLAHGLLKPSFVPEKPQRALRDLTRARSGLVAERARLANRIQKLLEEANIKLASVATDILGVSGRAMLQEIVRGNDDPVSLASNAKMSLRKKIPALQLALEGRVLPHQRTILGVLLKEVENLDGSVEVLEAAISDELAREDNSRFEEAVRLITTVPGVGETSARAIIAEIGADMDRFGSANRLCAWSGMAPGNHQSAGKRLSGKTLHGNKSLQATLVEAAWAATHRKDSYLSALYRRIAHRRGIKRALIAVGHSILRSIYHMLSNRLPYQDLGQDYFDRINPGRTLSRLTRRARELGFDLTPATT